MRIPDNVREILVAFSEALPFTVLLVIFFGVVAVIHNQHLFRPITNAGLSLDATQQAPMLFVANGNFIND
jgi:NhaB family Na+:H+ antiporter